MSEKLIGGLSGKLAATALRAAACRRRLTEVRAVLEPLLWDPYRTVYRAWGPPERQCVFCDTVGPPHDDDCPVLRRDALLGRIREE